jgi:hypothetical protein
MAEACSVGMSVRLPTSRSTSSDLKLPVFPRLQFEIVCSLPHAVEAELPAPMGFSLPPPLPKVFGCRRNGSSMESSQPFILSTCLSVCLHCLQHFFCLVFLFECEVPIIAYRTACGWSERKSHTF